MIRKLAASVERTVEKIEETKEPVLTQLFYDEVDEIWEYIWELPDGQREAYMEVYREQVESWQERIKEALK